MEMENEGLLTELLREIVWIYYTKNVQKVCLVFIAFR